VSKRLREQLSAAAVACLAAGLLAGLLVGRASAPDRKTLSPFELAPFPAPSRAAADVALADEPGEHVCGPDPFYGQEDEGGICLTATDDDPEQLAELRRVLRRESGLLAGKLGHLRTGQRALRERFTPYPKATTEIISIGDQIDANGVPMNLAYFRTEQKAPEILEFYANEFTKRGWSWTGVEENAEIVPHPAISATDPEEEVQMTVMVMEDEGEPSEVILGLADMKPEAELPVADVGDLPIYPGAQPVSVRSLDNELSSLTVNYSVSEASDTVAAFYRERMHELGYSEETGAPMHAEKNGDKLATLRFASDHGRWSLALSSFGNETGVIAVNTSQEVQP
jgi:hypothetical protein